MKFNETNYPKGSAILGVLNSGPRQAFLIDGWSIAGGYATLKNLSNPEQKPFMFSKYRRAARKMAHRFEIIGHLKDFKFPGELCEENYPVGSTFVCQYIDRNGVGCEAYEYRILRWQGKAAEIQNIRYTYLLRWVNSEDITSQSRPTKWKLLG